MKYYLLLVLLGMAALGSTQVGLLDPIASTWRGLATVVVPAAANNKINILQNKQHFQFN